MTFSLPRFLWLVSISLVAIVDAQAQPFKDEIDAFKKQDAQSMPPTGAVLFIGSSSIRLWKNLEQQFPKHQVINRGFGGSSLPDVEYYVKDIVLPYKPSRIVLYCGENDFAASDTVTAQTVFNRFVSLYLAIRVHYPLVPLPEVPATYKLCRCVL
ncbi:MAG: hypothetical protein MUE99_11010 [Chitinophagaceae bacterium]|nr:hypothetical protein [Chitinophagaceae bacterium]